MRAAPVLATLLLVVPLFAGCVGAAGSEKECGAASTCPGPAGPTAQPALVTESTGAIDGLVVDDSLQPLPGALVGIQGQPLSTSTDVAGAFTFNGLAPGRYVLLANALAYQAGSRAVDVTVGEVTTVQIVLAPLPTTVPFPETLQFTGLIECGWGVSGAGSGNCLPIQFILQQFSLPNPTNTQIIGLFQHGDALSIVQGVFEMQWDPSAATTAAELLLAVELEQTGAIGGEVYARASGPSPLRAVTDDAPWKALTAEPTNDQVQTRTFPASAIPPTFVVNQRFNVHATACHFAECGDVFTALADQ